MILYATLIAVAAAGASAGSAAQVQVEGRSFKVQKMGERAFVTPFGTLAGYNMDALGLNLSRRAAEKASGCLAGKSRPVPSGVMVKLDCSAAAPAAR